MNNQRNAIPSVQFWSYLWTRAQPCDIVLPNVFMLGWRFESDGVVVKKSGFWSEFEMKNSRADLLADLRKLATRRVNEQGEIVDVTKHDILANGPSVLRDRQAVVVPIPKHFWFVTIQGLADPEELPQHAGLVEYDGRSFRTLKPAPVIKHARKISDNQLRTLASKASHRLFAYARRSRSAACEPSC